MSTENKEVINFYLPGNEYFEFSNYYGTQKNEILKSKFKGVREYKLEYKGIKYPNSEIAYQSMKYYDTDNKDSIEYMKIISSADTPFKAYLLGRQQKHRYGNKWKVNKSSELTINETIEKYFHVKVRKDWEREKDNIMLDINREKYKQNPKLRELLLSTGDLMIQEDSPFDEYWGIGKDGNGQNKLGKILVKLREELKSTEINQK